MPRDKEEMKVAPRAVRVFMHDHSKRNEPEHAETLGRYRMNMMENDTFADAGLKALQRFCQEHPEQGRLVKVDIIMDKEYYKFGLDESLETLQDGEPLHIFLTEPSSTLSQETPKTPSTKNKTKSPQSQKGPATPNPPKSAKGTPSNPDHQVTAPGSAPRSSPRSKEVTSKATPQIEISSDSSDSSRSSTEDTDCIFMGQTPDGSQKPAPTPEAGSKGSRAPTNDGSVSRKVSSSFPSNRTTDPPVKKQASSLLPSNRTPVPVATKITSGHEHPVQPQAPKEPEASLPSSSSKSPKRTPSTQKQRRPSLSLKTAPSVTAPASSAKTESKTAKSQPAPSRASASSSSRSRNQQKDVYDVPSDTDDSEFITPQQDTDLRARIRALQDDVVPSSPLPQKGTKEQTASSRKPLPTPKAKVITIKDSQDSVSEESDEDEGKQLPARGYNPPSSSGAAFPGPSPCTRPSTRKSTDLIERLGEHSRATKKRLEEEAAAEEAAKKERAEAEARNKRVSSRDAIDQLKKMTNRKIEPRSLIEEIPDSFFEDTDLSDDHLGDDIIKGLSQSSSSYVTAEETPRPEVKRRQATPTTAFTPINTLYPKQREQANSNPTGKTFGLNYPKHFRDRFSDAEQSDEDDEASVGSEEEKFWRGEVLDEADGLPKAYKEYSWKYKTSFVSLGDRGYTYVGDGPWEGLILNGRHRGKYVFGCEPPSNAQIAEEEKNAEPRSQLSNLEESEADDDEEEKNAEPQVNPNDLEESEDGDEEDDAEQVQLPPCSLKLATPNSATPTSRRQTAQDAKVSDESDLRSADSEASSVMIRRQLEAECPPSNQQLGMLMSSSPSSKTPTARYKVAPNRSASASRYDDSPAQSDDDDEDTPKPISKLVLNNSGLSEGRKATIKKVTFSDEVRGEDDDETTPKPKPLAEVNVETAEKSEGDVEERDETILLPKPLAEIAGEEASDNEDGKEQSQASRVSALDYVLKESPRWLNSLTTTGQAQGIWKGINRSSATSTSPSMQRQKSEPPSSSAPPRFRSYTPIPPPVIPTFRAATPSPPAIEDRKLNNSFGSDRKRLASEPPKSATPATAPIFRSFTPVPPKSATQTTAPVFRSFTPVSPPSLPAYPRATPAHSKPSVNNSFSSQKGTSDAVQKQPGVTERPETPQKERDNLWDSTLSSPSASDAASWKSSVKKRRRRDSESRHSEVPVEESSSRKEKHKSKHHKKDKSARKSRHQDQQQQQQDQHSHGDGGETKATHFSDAEFVVSGSKLAAKNEYKKKHRKSLDDSAPPRTSVKVKFEEVEEDGSSHKKAKPSKKHRKSLDAEDAPSRKKRKHNHGDACAPTAAAAGTTNAPMATTMPPLQAMTNKPGSAPMIPRIVDQKNEEHKRPKSPATESNSLPLPPRNRKQNKKNRMSYRRRKQGLSRTDSVSATSPSVGT
ncbi:uncharacterized protein PG986_014093 [Apiospora aurea]|uniref:Nucleolar protein Dnt1-like N-terminal domain-containing protein n=1 Tax=Apiospora aurea TaxID=335848 RepID=A0ABR1PSG6_9PEZI